MDSKGNKLSILDSLFVKNFAFLSSIICKTRRKNCKQCHQFYDWSFHCIIIFFPLCEFTYLSNQEICIYLSFGLSLNFAWKVKEFKRTQSAFTYPKSTMNTRTTCKIYSKLTVKTAERLNCEVWKIFHIFFRRFHCWLWTSKCTPEIESLYSLKFKRVRSLVVSLEAKGSQFESGC